MITTIQIGSALKKKLDKLKIHHTETYNDLISRLIENHSASNVDKESLIETIDVLSDPETMRNIAEAMEEINKENYGASWEDIKKELGLNV